MVRLKSSKISYVYKDEPKPSPDMSPTHQEMWFIVQHSGTEYPPGSWLESKTNLPPINTMFVHMSLRCLKKILLLVLFGKKSSGDSLCLKETKMKICRKNGGTPVYFNIDFPSHCKWSGPQ